MANIKKKPTLASDWHNKQDKPTTFSIPATPSKKKTPKKPRK